MVKSQTHFGPAFLVSLCLLIVIVIPYRQVVHFDFVGYDDELYVTENLNVQNGISAKGIQWAFTAFHSANWHPITWLSHMLDYELFGLNPGGHHWTNVELHIANTVLLFIIFLKMTGMIWRSAFVAALFALHPLHVESVAWISERKDVLSTFFGLLTILAYCRYVKIPNLKQYFLLLLLLSLGLMAKPMLVTLPFVLLLLDFWPLERLRLKHNRARPSEGKTYFGTKGFLRLILEKIPFFIPVVISSILTFLAQKSEGAVKALEALSLKIRIANALVSYVNYVSKAIWPANLAVFYPHPGNTLPAWKIFGAALLIALAMIFSIRMYNRYPYVLIGLLWYLGTLVPVIGLVQVGDQAMADRYTYTPLIGLLIIFSWGTFDLLKKWECKKIFFGVSAIIILTVLAANTFSQLRHWKNGITLFEHAVKVTENNYQAQNNLGTALGSVDLDRAISHYKQALKIKPNYARANYNLGLALYEKGDYEASILHFRKALKINPEDTSVRNNLANVMVLQGKPHEAISQYKAMLKINSENADAHHNLAYVLSTQGKLDEAVLHYKEALRINPEYTKAHYNMGNILFKQGKMKEAVTHYSEVIKIRPDYVQAYNKIGLILAKQRKINKAEVFFSKALQIDPNYSEARTNLIHLQNSTSSK